MSVAAIEQLPAYWEPELVGQPEPRLVIDVAEMAEDQLVRLRAERLIRSVGGVALESQVEAVPAPAEKITSLMDAIHQAAAANETARKLVETNVRTDAIERTIKAGHIMRVELETDENGAVLQHGQYMEAVQANTLRHASQLAPMRQRAQAETRNAYRIESHQRQGLLEDYYFIVFSRAADDMAPVEMAEAGFFTDTMSTAIQATTKQGGKLVTESAFVAGKKSPDAPRHDKETIEKLAAGLGVDYSHKTATGIIDSPLLVHKSLMPNGAIDLVRLYDKAAGGTFFGEDKPVKDYLVYRQQCVEREKGFEPKIQAIVEELLVEAPSIDTPVMATQRLHKLSEKHMVVQAVEDKSINPRVFGPAAGHIEMARHYQERGDAGQAQAQTTQAIRTAKSGSCPNGGNATSAGPESNPGSEGDGEDQYGSLTFKCPKGHTNRRPHGQLLEKCRICGTSVRC